MKVVIIAGGKGTRLGLKDIPKPMIKISAKPILERQIELAKRYGINDFFILSGHLGDIIFDYFGNGENFGVKITHIIDPYPLGTAGSLKLLEHILTERFFVFYGDVVMDVDLKEMMKFDKKSGGIATLAAHPNDHPYDSDLIEVDENNYVKAFHPKPHKEGIHYRNLVNAALYIFSPEIFVHIPFGEPKDFGKHIFPELVARNEKLGAYKTAEYIKDVGTHDRLEKVARDFESGKVARLNRSNKRKAIFLDRDGVINKFVDNLSRVEDFELFEGTAETIARINKSEFMSIVVTNQPMIAKGFLTVETLNEMHQKMDSLLGAGKAYVDHLYYCPHHPQAGFEGEIRELKTECECRKPKHGMFFQAAKDFNIDLSNSWMVGDHERDIIAGRQAGCKTIYLNDQGRENELADYLFRNLSEAIDFILEKEHK
jgi:mannose-1-phosphate guanylyltransferase / phosphomannomutase